MRINDLNELPAHMQEQIKNQNVERERRKSKTLPPKRNKYGNEKTSGYDSKKEMKRHQVLIMLEKSGLISDLKTQVKFVLIPTQKDENGKTVERAVTYTADFAYTANGKQFVEDVKGYSKNNQCYILKRKLLLYVHGIKLIEV